MLCELARTDHHRFRVLVSDSDETKALRALSRAREDLVQTRVGLANQLRAELERFWPAATMIFAEIDSPIGLAFLARYPSPSDTRGRARNASRRSSRATPTAARRPPSSCWASCVPRRRGTVDYSLFVLARYREEIAAGRSPEAARAAALATSGVAVLFSGLTVIASLAGLLLVDTTALRSMAIGATLGLGLPRALVLPAEPLLVELREEVGQRLGLSVGSGQTSVASRPKPVSFTSHGGSTA